MQAIRTRYFGPTNSRGSRIQAKCEAGAVYVPYDHALNLDGNHLEACRALLIRMGWVGGNYAPMVGGTFAGDMYWVSLNDISSRTGVAS